MTNRRQFLTALAAAGGAATLDLAGLSTWLGPADGTLDGDPDDPVIRGLTERHLALWEGPGGNGRAGRVREAPGPGSPHASIDAMRATNPEWDFMGRTFLGLALLEQAVRRPDRGPRHLAAVDAMIADTVATLERRGALYFLLGYARSAPFLNPENRSLFVDGELAALIAARRLAGEHLGIPAPASHGPVQDALIAHITTHLDASPIGHGESYPDECWAFCNTFALVALTLDQATTRRDHAHRIARAMEAFRTRLVDPDTGMIVSEYTHGGRHQDGPEGSSIFLVSANLALLDPELGRDQYTRARHHLVRSLAGFGWAREWPDTWRGVMDIDSGPVIPVLDASAGASGLAFVGAGAWRDRETLSRLLASLELAAFPTWEGEKLYYAASNQVGDAVLLYALVQGPLWRLARGAHT